MARPIYGQDDWPRDFPGWMYLGTLIHFLNVAMNRDAEREDVVLGPYFEDRPSSSDLTRLETLDEQWLPHHRARMARGVALKAFRDGAIAPAWLDRHGDFQPVVADAWQVGAADDDLTKILMRFSLPARLIPDDEDVELSGAPSLYVPAEGAAAVVAAVNDRFLIPLPPSKVLERKAKAAAAFDSLWSVATAAVWVATRNLTIARGAQRYIEEMTRPGFREVRELALALLARTEIAYYYCSCRRPVCQCWSGALAAIVSRAEVGALVAEGFANDADNRVPVNKGAWAGMLKFAEATSIEPAKPGGDRWTHIVFPAADVMRTFPPRANQGASGGGDGATVEIDAGNAFPDPEAAERLAAQFDNEGIAIRDVKAALIAERWEARNGKPPKVLSITGLMRGGQKGRPGGGKMSDE